MVNVIALISFPPPLLEPLNLLSSHLMDHSTSLRLLLPQSWACVHKPALLENLEDMVRTARNGSSNGFRKEKGSHYLSPQLPSVCQIKP